MRFFPLRRSGIAGSHILPGSYQLTGLRCLLNVSTFSRPSSTRILPALFHAGDALGVLPFRDVFPVHESYTLSVCRSPHGVGQSLPFRVCFPRTVEVPDQRGHWPETAPLLGFALLGGIAASTGIQEDSSSLELFRLVPRRNSPMALQSLAVEVLAGALASPSTPFEVLAIHSP